MESCSTDDQGNQSCTSDKKKYEGAALGLGVFGTMSGGVGIMGLTGAPITLEHDVRTGTRESSSTERTACGDGAIPVGLQLGITGLPSASPGTVDTSGKVRIEVPADVELSPSASYPVEVVSVPFAIKGALTPGMTVGEVDLAPMAAARASRARALLAVADQYELDGAWHGDSEAKSAVTFACQPSGNDVCFDAIDNDCDGPYDTNCGCQSGALQWTLAWKTGDDLDLHVIGPDGAHVSFGARRGGSAGLTLDVDCLGSFGNNCLAQDVEKVFTPRDRKPMEGTYRGWVEVFRSVGGG